MTDAAIIGGGPTGLSAAVYIARADKRTLVFDDGGTSVGEGARAAINLLEEHHGDEYVDYRKLEAEAA